MSQAPAKKQKTAEGAAPERTAEGATPEQTAEGATPANVDVIVEFVSDNQTIKRRVGSLSQSASTDEKEVVKLLKTYWTSVLKCHGEDEGDEELRTAKPSTKGAEGQIVTLKDCTTGHLDELAFETLMPRRSLREWLEKLVKKGQLVLTGAPGCGKTFLARKLASWLLRREQGADRYGLVQFSAGYTYEDFVQGLRPTGGDQVVTDTLKDVSKKLKEFVDAREEEAQSNDDVEEHLRGSLQWFLAKPSGDYKKSEEKEWDVHKQKNLGILQAAASAAATVVGTSKTFQAVPGPLVKLGCLPAKSAPAANGNGAPAHAPAAPASSSTANDDLDDLTRALSSSNCPRANLLPEKLKVLVIDEMNRAKVADVFGECFFLLENRGASVTLRYSMPDDEFKLDPHLLIIGTMNTADRNVDEQMDVAFVQRFKWVELAPFDQPVSGLLPAFLFACEKDGSPGAAEASEWLPKLIEAWNGELSRAGYSDFAIGPRFFLDRTLYSERSKVVERIIELWRDDLYPYLRQVLKPEGRRRERELFELMMAEGGKVNGLPEKMKDAQNTKESPTRSTLRLPPPIQENGGLY